MLFRVTLPVEVERSTGDLSTSTTVPVQLIYQGGRWQAQCQDPPVATLLCETMEEALVAAVKEMNQDWAACPAQ